MIGRDIDKGYIDELLKKCIVEPGEESDDEETYGYADQDGMIEEGEINYGPDGSIIGSRPSPLMEDKCMELELTDTAFLGMPMVKANSSADLVCHRNPVSRPIWRMWQ